MKNSYGSSLAGTVVGEWEAVHDMAQPEASLTLPFHIVTLMARALLRHMAPLRRPLRPPPLGELVRYPNVRCRCLPKHACLDRSAPAKRMR